MKKLIYILFILSGILCYAATRPSHGPNALPDFSQYIPALKQVEQFLPKTSTQNSGTGKETQKVTSSSDPTPVGPHPGLNFLPQQLRPFGDAYYLKDILKAKVGKDNWISLKKMPKTMPQALIAIEDRRFYEHHGIDTDGILRAILVNIQADSVVQGASTITQQLIKNTLLTNKQSMERKITEAALALEVESRYDKEDILEMYLNTTYFGAGATGIKAAASTYFGLEPFQLSLPECATIAGLPYAPSALNPKENPKDCLERRNLVLSQMAKYGFIRQEEALSAQKEGLGLK